MSSSWVLNSYNVLRLGDVTAPDGIATIACGAVPVGYVWRVDGIAVACNALNSVDVLFYDQPPAPTVVPCSGTNLSLSYAAESEPIFFDVSDQASPLTILGGDQLYAVFITAQADLACLLRIQYMLMQGTAGAPTPVLGAVAPEIPMGI